MDNNETNNIMPTLNTTKENKGNEVFSTIIFMLATIGVMIIIKNVLNY